ncbi:MAG: YtxH domain-containing protein [Paramuribaculum sp.]|nr:YtxH domain-containing protein [Paramuribaculum sp.]
MRNISVLYAFIGGAIVGAGAALLLAPEKGETTRRKIKEILQKKGILCTENEIDALVEQLTSEIEEQ